MKEWTKEMEIQAPIEEVWKLFDGSLENMQKIMPQVVEHKPIKITEEGVGTVYRQTYKEGNRLQEYDVTTLEYVDDPEKKKLKVGFTLANLFQITALYELIQVNIQTTLFRYTVTNTPLKWFVKLLLLFAGEKVVTQFVERVKRVAESPME
ncbi:SRPBCC family protein [Ammoniphilus sp. YIM 78166]|uniref:SRPBCC family protein n=1 Tax=Ammoniphilus sp. YIM 78166 TaxID=1644106 RepID=UPI00106F49BD|nr:SRPBCC family protein [Ammoniphilus sp. YIM 78166]